MFVVITWSPIGKNEHTGDCKEFIFRVKIKVYNKKTESKKGIFVQNIKKI